MRSPKATEKREVPESVEEEWRVIENALKRFHEHEQRRSTLRRVRTVAWYFILAGIALLGVSWIVGMGR